MNRDLAQNMTDQPTPAQELSKPSSVNRRRLLVGGGVAALAAALAACSQSNQSSDLGAPEPQGWTTTATEESVT